MSGTVATMGAGDTGVVSAVRRTMWIACARWVLGLCLCLGAGPVLAAEIWFDGQDEQQFARENEILTVPLESTRREKVPKRADRWYGTTTIAGEQYEFRLDSTPGLRDEVEVAFDGRRVVALDEVAGDGETAAIAVIFPLIVVLLGGSWVLGRNLIPLRGLIHVAARRGRPSTEVVVTTWADHRHVGIARECVRGIARRTAWQLDLTTTDGRHLRWVGQDRHALREVVRPRLPRFDRSAPGEAATLVGGDRAGQWAYLVMADDVSGAVRILPPSEPLKAGRGT